MPDLYTALLVVGMYAVLHVGYTLRVIPAGFLIAVGVVIVAVTGRAQSMILDVSLVHACIAGPLIGAGLFAVSCIVSRRSLPAAVKRIARSHSGTSDGHDLRRISGQLGGALWEEAFWRGTVVYFASPSIIGIGLANVAFVGSHYPRVRSVAGLVDLAVVGLVLSVVYLALGDVLVVAVAHWVRNALILVSLPREETHHDC